MSPKECSLALDELDEHEMIQELKLTDCEPKLDLLINRRALSSTDFAFKAVEVAGRVTVSF